ncbi:MAG: hypothetical protein EOO42_10620 [Flavobacteriales bacterium]|nr:MAG: hypothetical protein EOO42_10620 [Flavobacteriales bacterium]
MNRAKALICIVIPILLGYALNTKFGDLPPILKFLNPFTGFWQNAEGSSPAKNKKLAILSPLDQRGILSLNGLQSYEFVINEIFS